jgi:hypothetical protein
MILLKKIVLGFLMGAFLSLGAAAFKREDWPYHLGLSLIFLVLASC